MDQQVDLAAQTGSEDPAFANVQDSVGDFHSLPIEQVPAAVSTGQFSLADPQAIQQYKTSAKYGTPAQAGIAGLEAAGRGLSFGLSTGVERALGVEGKDILGREEENPVPSFLGTGVGLGVSSLIPGVGEANILHEAGQGASSALDLGLGAKIATEGALLRGGDEVSHMLAGDPNQSMETAAANIGLAAVLGGVGGVALGTVSPLWNTSRGLFTKSFLDTAQGDFAGATAGEYVPKISPILKKALSTFGGVSPENIDAYIANHEAIASSPDYESIYNHVLNHIQELNSDLDNNKITASQAANKYNDLLSDLKNNFRQKGADATTAASEAKKYLSDAQGKLIDDIREEAVARAPTIVSAVENLRSQVIDGSNKAYDILDNTPGEMSLDDFISKARGISSELRKTHSPSSLSMASHIDNTVDTLIKPHENIIETEVPTKVMDILGQPISGPIEAKTSLGEYKAPYSRIKTIIKELDPLSKWDYQKNEIEKGLSPYYKQLRASLDQELKDSVGEYRDAMKPLAERSSLLNKLGDYGTPEKASSSILGLKTSKRFISDMPILRELEQKTGIKFTKELDQYASPALKEIRLKALPEYAQSEIASARAQSLKDPATQQALLKMSELSPEYSESVKSIDELAKSKQAAESVRGLSESNVQSRLNSVMNGKNIANRKLLDGVPGMEGLTIPQALDLVRVRSAFEKGAMNGSRNVNLMRSIGAGIGGVFGGAAGGLGGAAVGAGIGNTFGSVAGGYIDKSGPEMVQAFLDKYIAKNGKQLASLGADKAYARPIIQAAMQSGEQSSVGFKAAIDYAKATHSGSVASARAAKAIFKSGVEAVPFTYIPKEKDIHNLDKSLQEVSKDPQKLLNVGGHIGHYLPNHATAAGSFSANAVNYLESQRPRPMTGAPLDATPPLTAAQKSDWARTLSVAQMPLVVMQHIKDGTLLASDVQTIRTLYPHYYSSLVQKITDEMIDHISKDGKIPYNMRQSLSLFTGTPLDSSLMPQNIQAAQGTFMAQQQAQAPQTKPVRNTSKLGEISKQYQTAEQSAQSRRSEP